MDQEKAEVVESNQISEEEVCKGPLKEIIGGKRRRSKIRQLRVDSTGFRPSKDQITRTICQLLANGD